MMAGGFVGVDLFLASGRLLGSCALSVRCGPGNTGQDTIGFEIEIEITYFNRIIMDLHKASIEELLHTYIYKLKSYIKGYIKAHI